MSGEHGAKPSAGSVMDAHQKVGIDRAAGIGPDFSLFFAGYADQFFDENRQRGAKDEEIDNAVIV